MLYWWWWYRKPGIVISYREFINYPICPIAVPHGQLIVGILSESAKPKFPSCMCKMQEHREDSRGILHQVTKYGVLTLGVCKIALYQTQKNSLGYFLNTSQATSSASRTESQYDALVMSGGLASYLQKLRPHAMRLRICSRDRRT